jgi:hypothetical protein
MSLALTHLPVENRQCKLQWEILPCPAGGNSAAIWLEKNFMKYIENFWQDGKAPGDAAARGAPCSGLPSSRSSALPSVAQMRLWELA